MTTASRKLFLLPPVAGSPEDWLPYEDIAQAGNGRWYLTFRLDAQKAILQNGMRCRLVTPTGAMYHAHEPPAETIRAVSSYWFMLGHGHHFGDRGAPAQGEYRVTWTTESGVLICDYHKRLTW